MKEKHRKQFMGTIMSLYCIDFEQLKGLSLVGNYLSNDFRFVEIDLVICYGKPECATEEEIVNFMNTGDKRISFIYTNSSIKKEDWEKPIEVFADDSTFYFLNSNLISQANVYVRNSYLT